MYRDAKKPKNQEGRQKGREMVKRGKKQFYGKLTKDLIYKIKYRKHYYF